MRLTRARGSSGSPDVTVVRFDEGEKVKVGTSSFSNLIITDKTTSSNSSTLGYSVYTPGTETKQKVHVDADELAYVVSGTGKLTVGERLVSFGPGDSLHVPAGVPHGVRNDGKVDLAMVFFFPSRNYPRTVDA